MTETTQLSGKIKHKCSKIMLLTPQELFELDRYIESLRASGSFTVLRSAHASSQTAAAVRTRSAFTSAASRR